MSDMETVIKSTKLIRETVLSAIAVIRECARTVTPDPDPKEAARLAYYDAEQNLRQAFGLPLEFSTDVGWPPKSS